MTCMDRQKRGLILCGLTGVGKSTLQATLLEMGCWTPRLITSRSVEEAEEALVGWMPREQLVQQIRSGELVAPIVSADEFYAWPRSDFERLRTDPAAAVLTTRPYTALLLAAAVPGLLPVWLELPQDERLARLAARSASRDKAFESRQRRIAQDGEDAVYREMFCVHVVSDGTALSKLTKMLSGALPPYHSE